MAENLIKLIRENVIQGRVTSEDEGVNKGMEGQPGVLELIDQALAENIEVALLIDQGLTGAMDVVGQKFEAGEYFIPDMLASAEAVGAAMEKLEPYFAASGIKPKGKILVATVKGDLHDIGKNIVSILLRGAGYSVKDLGNDVTPEDIVAAIKEEKPEFLGLSALLTSTMAYMEDTVRALVDGGVRDSVKVIIGGAPVTEEFANTIGADGYGNDGFQAIELVKALSSK
ncbi:B12-binding domain-containing protein [Chloroflexota bacterium]